MQYLLHLNASDVSSSFYTIHQQIIEAGAVVSSYIPDNTLLVVAQPEKLEALKKVAGILPCLHYRPHLKGLKGCITHHTVAVVLGSEHTGLFGTGVVWVGDYHEAYKASPEAQRLVGWAAAQPTPTLQQAGSKQSTPAGSSRPAKGMHAFVRQTDDGSNVVVLDVSFPQSLAEGLGSSDSTSQQQLQQNVTASLTSFVIKPQPKFHPANAALADWQAPLDVVCHSQCRLAASGPGRLSVTAPAEFAEVHLTGQ